MTKYAGRRAVVLAGTGEVGLAIAKRLVEGGAKVVLAASAPQECAHAEAELGSAARVVTPNGHTLGLDGHGADLVFASSLSDAEPLLPSLSDGGAIVFTAAAPGRRLEALAAELAGRGIRVNAVVPGCMAVPGSAAPLPPLGRRGSAEEVARAALFLAAEATFTTGARIPVDGGLNHESPSHIRRRKRA